MKKNKDVRALSPEALAKMSVKRRVAYYRARGRAMSDLPLTNEEKARWAPMLHTTWEAIGADVEALYSEPGNGRLTKGGIVEMVCDANRIEMYGGMTHDEYEFLVAVYSRPATKRWLYKEMNYS